MILNCKQYSRNNRDRDKQDKNNINNQLINNQTDEFKVIFYTDLLDTIHCYFCHSYDVGFRMRSCDLAQIFHHDTTSKNNASRGNYYQQRNLFG